MNLAEFIKFLRGHEFKGNKLLVIKKLNVNSIYDEESNNCKGKIIFGQSFLL